MNTQEKITELEYIKKEKMKRVELLLQLVNDALTDYHRVIAQIEELKADLDYE